MISGANAGRTSSLMKMAVSQQIPTVAAPLLEVTLMERPVVDRVAQVSPDDLLAVTTAEVDNAATAVGVIETAVKAGTASEEIQGDAATHVHGIMIILMVIVIDFSFIAYFINHLFTGYERLLYVNPCNVSNYFYYIHSHSISL